jgi:cytochrome c oxidase cbb3-type subunit 3
MRYYGRFAVSSLAVVCLIALVAAAETEDKTNPYTGDTEAIAQGAKLYKRFNCYACHGMAGGGGMGPSISDDDWKEGSGSDASLMRQLMEGRAAMPPFAGIIGEDDAWKVIAFVRTLYKGDPAKVTW